MTSDLQCGRKRTSPHDIPVAWRHSSSRFRAESDTTARSRSSRSWSDLTSLFMSMSNDESWHESSSLNGKTKERRQSLHAKHTDGQRSWGDTWSKFFHSWNLEVVIFQTPTPPFCIVLCTHTVPMCQEKKLRFCSPSPPHCFHRIWPSWAFSLSCTVKRSDATRRSNLKFQFLTSKWKELNAVYKSPSGGSGCKVHP